MSLEKKAEQLVLVDVSKARRRGPPVYPKWKVVVHCLDCPYTSTVMLQAYDMHTAKKTVVDQLRKADEARTAKHRHRYASAAGPVL